MNKTNSQHLTLLLKNLPQSFQKESILSSLSLPSKELPKVFMEEREDLICFGYYLFFDTHLDAGNIVSLAGQKQWKKLAHYLGNFLIIYIDLKMQEIYILSDIFGSFPVFFAIENDQLSLSTDFGVVSRSLIKKTLNTSSALDFILTNYILTPSTQTIIDEIQQVPPGTLLKINKEGNFSFTALQDINKFVQAGLNPYNNIDEFTNDFLELLHSVIEQRIKALKTDNIEVDLSSGLDCTLVAYVLSKFKDINLFCYSRVSTLALGDTHPPTMIEFAKKHNLRLNIIEVDNFYPFCNNHDLSWTRDHFYPADHGQELFFSYSKIVREAGFKVNFTGNGGDELYMAPEIGKTGLFYLQQDYFSIVQSLKFDNGLIFSDEGKRQAVNKDRFTKKEIFPVYQSVSAVALLQSFFPILWELDLWGVHPLMDPRLIQLTRAMPLKDNALLTKDELWSSRPDIFVKKQFEIKGHYGEHVGQFLKFRGDFVTEVLRNSILGKLGLIKNREMAQDIQSGAINKYLDTPLLILHNLIKLEYFIQENQVSIS